MPTTCPMCAEDVFPGARTCEHCGEPLFGADDRRQSYGLSRQGKTLVREKDAELPNRCVKSNEPTQRRLKRSLSWHHPALILLVFAGVLIYVIVALVMRKQATIHIGLSDAWFQKRRRTILISWGIVLLSIGLFAIGITMTDKGDAGPALILG